MNLAEKNDKVFDGISVCIDRYLAMVINNGAMPIQSPNGVGINHAYWMLLEMYSKFGTDSNFDTWKACRWLGFIQHEVISAGYATVEAERNFTRSYFSF